MSTTYSMPFARRSALRLSCLAVASMASVAFLAACDDNQPTAPKPPSAPVTAAPIVIPIKTGSIVMKVFDEKQALITTSSATYQIIRSNGGITSTWTLKDGLVNDSEPEMGVSLMKGFVPGTYQVCETEAPVDYALAKPACGVVTVYAGATVGLYLVNPHLPKITFKVVDFIGNLVPNMTFTIKDSANVYSSLVVDNGPLDSDPVGGQVALTLPFESKYTLCETTLPPGYAFPLAQIKFCFDYTVKNGGVEAGRALHAVSDRECLVAGDGRNDQPHVLLQPDRTVVVQGDRGEPDVDRCDGQRCERHRSEAGRALREASGRGHLSDLRDRTTGQPLERDASVQDRERSDGRAEVGGVLHQPGEAGD